MKRTRGIGLLLVLVSVVVASLAAQSGDVRAAIEAANDKFEAAAAKGDAATVSSLYTEDAQLMPSNSETVAGTEAIAAFWSEALGSGVGLTLSTKEVNGAGDTAWEVGAYEMKGADGALLDRGKYVVIWKRVNGDWKLHRDIWNTSQPAAGSQ